MTILRMFYAYGFIILATLIFVMLDAWFHLGLTNDGALDVFITPFVMIWGFVIAIPTLRKNFFSWFVLDNKKILISICFPIIAGILIGFLVNIYRLIPYWLGYDPVGVGSNQVTVIKDVSNLGLLLGLSVLGPFSEEFIFRYLLFAQAPLLLSDYPKEHKWFSRLGQHFQEKKKIYLICWIIIVNAFFGILHGPDLITFPIYFLPGIVYTLFFLRYGFLAAWLSHGMFNFFSGITLQITLYIFRIN